jgi:hypothetical protein
MKKYSVLVTMLLLVIVANYLFAQQETKPASIRLVNAKLGKEIKDRMIVDEDSSFTVNSKVYLWLKVTGGNNEEITITWKNGELTHETKLTLGGSPWRTWAEKTLYKPGDWTVTVTDKAGQILKEISFKVQ